MENYSIVLPAYTIGDDAYGKVAGTVRPFGRKAVIIGGRKALAAAMPHLGPALAGTQIEVLSELLYGTDCTYEAVEALKKEPSVQEADMLFGVGGGKALDTVKVLADELGKPDFTFPTIGSNCAATTAVSIMYYPDGRFMKPHFFAKPAQHCFISTRVIAAAPAKYLWAGMGDTHPKNYEASVSARGEEVPHYFGLGITVSRMCVDPILTYGEEAMKANREGRACYALEQVILAVVVTTGIASILLTAEHTVHYNSGLAHAIFYALTAYPQIEERHLHGEVVAFGILILLLVDGQREEFERVYAFHKKVGLPVKTADIEISPEELEKALPVFTTMGDIAHWPYRVSVDMLKKAFDTLEEMAD